MTPSDPILPVVAASRLQLPPGNWKSLLDGLCARFARISRAQWQDRFARGRVQDAQGRALLPGQPWQVGLEIRYFREVEDEPVIPFAERIVHHDAHLLVADKPHFLPVVPAGGHVQQTLLARLMAATSNTDLVPLHRLDRLTAGLLAFGIRPEERSAYQQLFARREVEKEYEALAMPEPGSSLPRSPGERLTLLDRLVTVRGELATQVVPGAVNAETELEMIAAEPSGALRVRLRPRTGRTHQLRAQLAARGAPILGEDLYGTTADVPAEAERPLQLLARRLAFRDPCTAEPREFLSTRELEAEGRVPGSRTLGR